MAAQALVAAVALSGAACPSGSGTGTRRADTPSEQKPEEATKMANYPQITEARQLPAVDGQVVELVGTYRKALTAVGKKGDEEEVFVGYAAIEVEGKCSDYDPAAWDGEPPVVQLGLDKRPEAEVEQFADKRVRVFGKLVMDPNVAEDPEAAMMDAEPALIEVEGLQLAP